MKNYLHATLIFRLKSIKNVIQNLFSFRTTSKFAMENSTANSQP